MMKHLLFAFIVLLYCANCHGQTLRVEGEPFDSPKIWSDCTTDNNNNLNSRLIVTSNLPLGKVDVDGNAYVRKLIKTGRMFIDFMPNHGGIIRFNVDQCRPLEIVIPDFVVGGTEYELHIIYENNTSMPFLPSPLVPYAVLKDGTLTFYYDTNKPNEAYGLRTEDKPEWELVKDKITEVVFDQSFKNFKPRNCNSWFKNCTHLTSIKYISDYLNTEDVIDMSYMFYGCSSLTSLDVSKFKTGNVSDMEYMFYGCSSLMSLDVSMFNTGNVIDMRCMFSGCRGLTSLDVSKFNTRNVEDMGYMFADCRGLMSLDVSKFNTRNVKDMGGMFDGCSGLTSLDVSKFNTWNVEDMGSMFYGCSGLTSLDVSKFDTENVSDMSRMFYDCSNLTCLDVSKFNTADVTDMSEMFYNCCSIDSLDVKRFNTVNVTDMSGMFADCRNLTSLNVSKFYTMNVEDMNLMFCNCRQINILEVTNFNTAKVTNMHGMFSDCRCLTNLDIHSFDTRNVTDMECMFANCFNLKTIYVGNDWNTSSVKKSDAIFSGCVKLVGGKKTKCDGAKRNYDKNFARIDEGHKAPGYFTRK